jgi:hypothetical protein
MLEQPVSSIDAMKVAMLEQPVSSMEVFLE